MALQTSIPIRLTIAGDGESTELRVDLKNTPVQFLDGRYAYLPRVPEKLLWVSVGGPGISPELPEMAQFMQVELEGSILSFHFGAPLLKDKEHYTVEFIFGYDGVQPAKEEEPADFVALSEPAE